MSDEPGVNGLLVCPLSPSRGEDGELDLDSVHMLLRNFQQELRDTQRERVPDTSTLPQRHHKNSPPSYTSIIMLDFSFCELLTAVPELLNQN